MVDIVWRFTVTWEAGNLACKFIKFMQALVTYASTYVLVALSIDRYDAITHPMNFSNCCTYYLYFKWTILCFWRRTFEIKFCEMSVVCPSVRSLILILRMVVLLFCFLICRSDSISMIRPSPTWIWLNHYFKPVMANPCASALQCAVNFFRM
jgi:hypothetical protein